MAASVAVDCAGSSPHTRGALWTSVGGVMLLGIIPAYAGSTMAWHGEFWTRRDHPRIRGEHFPAPSSDSSRPGSSPHTRGALPGHRKAHAGAGIIPAYAGSTTRTLRRTSTCRDHPRIRGEHERPTVDRSMLPGLSPHTRGAPTIGGSLYCLAGIIPAYAGSTGGHSSCCLVDRDHPRIRGEHSTSSRKSKMGLGSSPHTRGARSWWR